MTRKDKLTLTRAREVVALAALRGDYAWHVAHGTHEELLDAYVNAVAWREMRIANVDWHIAQLS